MLYEELHSRFGTHVSQRVRRELSDSEFHAVQIDNLAHWLEARAEAAHEKYRGLLNNPLASSAKDAMQAGDACSRWREAEDLAYLVVVAEDVGDNARVG